MKQYITIPLTKGYTTIISAEDADLAKLKWFSLEAPQTVYAQISPKIHPLRYLHRAILERMVGRPLTRKDKTDHINGDGLDNRRENLRLATNAQNSRNSRINRNNTSGYKGVWQDKRDGRWYADITVNYKKHSLGCFPTPEAAYDAYCEAAKRLHGDFHNLG